MPASRPGARIGVFVLLTLLLAAGTAAAWSHDAYENDVRIQPPASTTGQLEVLPDGAGGRVLVWADFRTGFTALYASRLDAEGQVIWGATGQLVLPSQYDIFNFEAVSDASGAVYVVVQDSDDSVTYGVFVQKIMPDGSLPWGGAGLNVNPSVTGADEESPSVVADGAGGCVVVWTDDRSGGATSYDIFAQRFNQNGGRLWGGSGVTVCDEADLQISPQIISSDGNLIVAWEDQRSGAANGFDIFAQRLSVVGAPQWAAQGLPVTQASGSQRFFDMAPSGDGGALFAWRDERNSVATSNDVYAQRLNADGARLYSNHGAPVCVQAGSQYDPRIVSDGASGAYVVWRDSRPGDAYSATIYYAQRLTGDGYGIWTSDGITLAADDGYQDRVVIERDQAGRLAAVWTDTRDNVYSNLFGQIVSPAGSRVLGFSGTAVSLAPFNQGPLALTIDDRNGIIATFLDNRTAVSVFIAEQRLDASGYLGDPAPVALSVTDAPQDQGGQVLLEWQRSWLDDAYQTGINGYTVWRRWTGSAKAVVDPALAADLAAQLGADPAAVADHLKAGWTYVGETPAQEFAAYGFDAPTYADSTGAGEAPTEFQVVAVGYSGQLWHSNAVSGHSVDNLAPGAPLQLAGMLNGADVDLDWTPAGVNDEDLDGYRVYRAATPGVIPGAGTFVGTVADTLYTDAAPPSGPLYYVVTAVDVHGNEGDPSNEVMLESVTGVDHDGLPGRFALAGASPNPFNPATDLRLDVPREGRVTLTIHDARGALVRTLQDARLTAGRHAVRWDGRADDGRAVSSGAYFARARFGDGATSTAKLLLAR